MPQKNKVFIAIYMITYNHEAYIKQAIDSVLMQKCNFRFKIFIGEDCSTDHTREICLEYANSFPDKINLIISDKNVGATINAHRTFKACFESNAPYVALLEGDDYWTDPLKLQKQVDFLEANKDFAICFHKVKVLKPDGQLVDDFITKYHGSETTIYDLIKYGNYIHTPSVVFRNYHIDLPEEFYKSSIGDYFLHLLNAQFGKIKYLDEVMAVYRFEVGIYSSLSIKERESKALKTYLLINHYFWSVNKLLATIIREKIKGQYFSKLIIDIKSGNWNEGKKLFDAFYFGRRIKKLLLLKNIIGNMLLVKKNHFNYKMLIFLLFK